MLEYVVRKARKNILWCAHRSWRTYDQRYKILHYLDEEKQKVRPLYDSCEAMYEDDFLFARKLRDLHLGHIVNFLDDHFKNPDRTYSIYEATEKLDEIVFHLTSTINFWPMVEEIDITKLITKSFPKRVDRDKLERDFLNLAEKLISEFERPLLGALPKNYYAYNPNYGGYGYKKGFWRENRPIKHLSHLADYTPKGSKFRKEPLPFDHHSCMKHWWEEYLAKERMPEKYKIIHKGCLEFDGWIYRESGSPVPTYRQIRKRTKGTKRTINRIIGTKHWRHMDREYKHGEDKFLAEELIELRKEYKGVRVHG